MCISKVSWNQYLYIDILDKILVPFITDVCPYGHRFMLDCDHKHTSLCARAFMNNNGVNCWPTPPELPHANSIESYNMYVSTYFQLLINYNFTISNLK